MFFLLFCRNYLNNIQTSYYLNDKLEKTYSTLVDIINIFDTGTRVTNALPKSLDDLKDVFKRKAEDGMRSSFQHILAENTIIERDVTWIEENGLCLDLIRPGKSTISQAGRGAFSRSHIKKDSIISPVPLNTINDSDNMLMYELIEDEEGDWVRKDDKPIGKQLLLNYCFGHHDSKLLLCPMTNAVLINHCSSRASGGDHCGNEGPNAKITWASPSWDHTTAEWLGKSLEEIHAATKLGHRGLSFEVVATRDIKPGEEIFVDYGIHWEQAWNDHVLNWQTNDSNAGHIAVRSMIDNKLNHFRTVDELEDDPYPDNVLQVCLFKGCSDEESEEENEEKEINGNFIMSAKTGIETEESLYPCDILNKFSSSRFTVRIHCPYEKYVVTNYSNENLTFRMNGYASDQHLSTAFRHFIEIDDAIFPKEWKNSKS